MTRKYTKRASVTQEPTTRVKRKYTKRAKPSVVTFPWPPGIPKTDMTLSEVLTSISTVTGNDPVNHPVHYTYGGIETIDFIEAKSLNYALGQVIKYVSRADHKGRPTEDLQKALWYLTRELSRRGKA